MSFVRVGDTAAYDPRTLHPLEYDDGDIRHVNEVFGFSVRLAGESGGKEHDDTDRRVTRSMVLQMAGSKAYADWLMGFLVAAKVWVPDGTGYRLMNDPNYIHLLLQDEIDRNRIRKRDAKNPRLVAMALLRDGDNCRACGRRVNWADRKSPAGGTWEHVNINNQPTSQHEYVVYCFGCQNDPMADVMEPPLTPHYSSKTRDRIKDMLGSWPTKAAIAEYISGLRTLPGTATSRQRPEPENATPTGLRTDSGNAATGLRPGTENATTADAQRPEKASGNAGANTPPDPPPKGPDGGSSADQMIRGLPDLAPPGRDGTGSASPGLTGTGRVAPEPGRPPTSRSRRRKPTPLAQHEEGHDA